MECKLMPGQLVVCVARDPKAVNPVVPEPVVGCIYTVSEVGIAQFGRPGQPAVFVEEIIDQVPRYPGHRFGHPHWLFRPCRPTNIEPMRRWLDPRHPPAANTRGDIIRERASK